MFCRYVDRLDNHIRKFATPIKQFVCLGLSRLNSERIVRGAQWPFGQNVVWVKYIECWKKINVKWLSLQSNKFWISPFSWSSALFTINSGGLKRYLVDHSQLLSYKGVSDIETCIDYFLLPGRSFKNWGKKSHWFSLAIRTNERT